MKHQRNLLELIPCWVRVMIILGFLGLVWGNPVLTSVGNQEVPVAEDPQILWKVQSSQNTIYLAGSIHVL
jgi:hypothetical protein